ncbi:MAG: hypothetical protein WCP59_11050 [Actinomycetota bacterium]|jgi:hypothetical protein
MNVAQRIVVSLALAAVLGVAARTACDLMVDSTDGGWFMYEPNVNVLTSPSSDGDSLQAAAVWLVAISLWLGISWRLFRTKSE